MMVFTVQASTIVIMKLWCSTNRLDTARIRQLSMKINCNLKLKPASRCLAKIYLETANVILKIKIITKTKTD